MSAGDKAWNLYWDKFGKEPANSQQLQNFAKKDSTLDNLNYKSARDCFNKNKGKGRSDGIQSKSEETKKSNVKKPKTKPPPKPKTKSKSKSKSKTKTNSKTATVPVPKPITTLKAPTKHDTVPSGSEYEEDDEYEYYYEEEQNNNKTQPTSLPPPVMDADSDDNEALDGNETQPKKKLLFPGFGDKKKVKSVSADMDNGDEVTSWQPTQNYEHDGGEVNYTGYRLHDEKSNRYAWIALALSIMALIVSIIGMSAVAGVLHSKLSKRSETLQTPDLEYDGLEGIDNEHRIIIGDFYGWEHTRRSDVQYPLHDIHVTYGDILVFKRRDDWPPDDLYLVPKEVYENCNFSYPYNLTNDAGDMDNQSSLWLADMKDMYCPLPQTWRWAWDASTCQYEFPIDDWSDYKLEANDNDNEANDLFAKLIKSDILYFTSSHYWDRSDNAWNSCKGGLKLKVIIHKKKRKLMPLKKSSDAWREIGKASVIKAMHASVGHISRQLILSQFNAEQRIRSEGDSGLTQVRGQYDGDAAYDDGTFTNGAVASIHDHSDNILVVGIGEIQAVLNGVEFVTRHNDYNLNMPSETESTYGKTQPIPYPNVPPQVTNAGNVNNQITEMQEWFRAFKTQNKSHRNYTNYFKPILCYLEGTWIVDTDVLDEPFDSDRHAIDARTWKQLHDKIRWMLNSGRKNSLENLAHLPSAVRSLVNDTYPIISNWEYRILCSPLKNDIPTSRFRIVNDLSVQLMGSPQTRDELTYSRRARFQLNRYINLNNRDGDHRWSEGRKRWNYLDYLMEQIPGKDNYGANLTDLLPDGSDISIHYNTDKTLNSAYYSRFFGLKGADAMGSAKHRRGWSDRNFFAAETTHTHVSPVDFNFEEEDEEGKIKYTRTVSRWSYAIPLEIIYQTPLSKWNPHNIAEIDRNDFDYSRSGTCVDSNTAFNGWTINNAYFTPAGFYQGLSVTSSADTASDNVCANGDGGFFPVYSSGHWITFPEIGNGVGKVRQRYPIFPIHGAGTPSFKEVKALQAVILDDDYDDPIANPDGFFGDDRDLIYGFEVNLQGGGHQHVMYIPGWKVRNYWRDNNDIWLMSENNVVEVESDTRNTHSHTVTVWRDQDINGVWVYHIKACRFGSLSDDDQYTIGDWEDAKCIDNHDSIGRE